MRHSNHLIARRSVLLASVSLLLALGSAPAIAADAPADATNAPATAQPNAGLEEIVVTAQKREQRLLDVPIAVTALSQNTLKANRIVTVADLSSLAPGVVVRTSAGGQQLPSFSVRGVVSYGIVPGSDKEVSVYLDGVYISSSKGGIFSLPDVSQLEMLRGPQGTLFGRNATAGAISIMTRDPSGKLGFTQELTTGNYNQFRTRTSIDTPTFGPFSAYGTFVHEYKRGDIRNAGAGQVWDRTASPGGYGVSTSPQYLGTRDSNSIFLALKFEPSDTFKTVYKFDRDVESGTPEGVAFVGLNQAAPGIGALIGPVIGALLTSQSAPVYTDTNAQRPNVVNNSWAIPTKQSNFGHSLTSTLRLTDHLTVKNIAAYRGSHIFATDAIDGLSALALTQQAVVPLATFQAIAGALPLSYIPILAAGLQKQIGQPYVILGTEPEGYSHQWSDEVQVNFNSKLLTLTSGALWFHSKEITNPFGLPSTVAFSVVPNGALGLAGTNSQGVNYNRATSIAAYTQAELHVTSQIDVVGGIRVTNDKKSGDFVYGVPSALSTISFNYEKTKPNYLIGINYKPIYNLLVYAKYSTAFVSGGSVAGNVFAPETASSYEAGIKGSAFNNRLQGALAVYHVTYQHFQTAQSATNFPNLPNASVAGTIIVDQGGPVKAKGVELELSAAPMRGFTLGGNLGYTDTKFQDVNPVLVAQAGGEYDPTLRSKWTGAAFGQYETEPLFDDARLMLRADATYHSRFLTAPNQSQIIPAFASLYSVPGSWNLNTRAALRGIKLGGMNAEVAIWSKNLTQNREATFPLLTLNLIGSTTFVPARTFGVDLSLKY